MTTAAPTHKTHRDSRLEMAAEEIWSLTATDTAGDSVAIPFADKVLQFASSNWNSVTLVAEGSLDNVTFFQLTDPQGNAISATADKIEQVEELCFYVRVRVTAGTVHASGIKVVLGWSKR